MLQQNVMALSMRVNPTFRIGLTISNRALSRDRFDQTLDCRTKLAVMLRAEPKLA